MQSKRTLCLLWAFCLTVLLPITPVMAQSIDMTGEWVLTGGTAASQTFSVTSASGGSFSGTSKLPGGEVFGTISGSVSGNSVVIVNPYFPSFASGYTATFTGTLDETGTQISGTWVSTWSQRGTFVFTRALEKQVVEGLVTEREREPGSEIKEKKPVPGIAITLVGTDKDSNSVSKSTTTDSDGRYAIEVKPGTYTVRAAGEAIGENGGTLSADPKAGGACAGDAVDDVCKLVPLESGQNGRADFAYTLCSAPERMWNGKPLTSCPVVFVPGFLGSRIVCNGGTEELWANFPKPRWGDMLLQPDGATNAVDNGECTASAAVAPGKDGLIGTVAGQSIYQTISNYLNEEKSIGPFRWWAAPYDWRKSPVLGVPSLDQVVDSTLERTGAKYVVLYGHSMGGLVMREYLSDAARARKVVRVLTAGTPYWGAPKSHFSLLEGDTDTPQLSPLDIVTSAKGLQKLAQNLQGLFFLNPSANFGPWLFLAEGPFGNYLPQSEGGVYDWVARLGGNPNLAQEARYWHALRDGFPDLGMRYEVVVGAGSPTVIETKIRVDAATWANIIYGNGDGTVPLVSATQGASDSGSPLGAPVGIRYICNVGHVALPGDATVLNRVGDYLTRGGEIKGTDDKCNYSGATIGVFKLNLSAGNVVPQGFAPLSFQRQGSPATGMGLEEATRNGLIQLYQLGEQTFIVTDDRKPVTITLKGKGLAVQTQRIASEGDGPVEYFKAVNGSISINTANVFTAAGGRIEPFIPSKRRPKTVATVVKKNKWWLVKLKATSPNGIAATYYKLGTKARAKKYKKPFKLTNKKLKALRVSSVDLFGLSEKMHRLPRR